MVYRLYVEKKPGLRHEAKGLLNELRSLLGITALTGLRLVNRYDVEGIEQSLFDYAVNTVFSEPQVDNVTFDLPTGTIVFAVVLFTLPILFVHIAPIGCEMHNKFTESLAIPSIDKNTHWVYNLTMERR